MERKLHPSFQKPVADATFLGRCEVECPPPVTIKVKSYPPNKLTYWFKDNVFWQKNVCVFFDRRTEEQVFKNKICLYVLMSRFKTEEQKNIKFRLLCLKLKELCLYVLMSKTKKIMSLCQEQKRPVFMSKNLKIMSNKFNLCMRS